MDSSAERENGKRGFSLIGIHHDNFTCKTYILILVCLYLVVDIFTQMLCVQLWNETKPALPGQQSQCKHRCAELLS